MYKSFYNLSERPFQISSDPRYLWLGADHSEALAVLKYGLISENGFLLLTGDVGAGKTTLVNALLKSLDDTVLVANVTDPSLSLTGFLNHIAQSFNIPERFNRKEDFLLYFKDFLQNTYLHKGKQVLLIIDEAHNLSGELLEQIRLLSNIELPEKKLINIFFVGQNELNQRLMTNECRALRQRVTLNYNIKPLSATETHQYINHRLKVAGTETQLFVRKAVCEIYRFSGGCPRLINMICDRALLTGYVRGLKKITANTIKECSQEVLLPGETKEDLHFNIPQPIRADGPTPGVKSFWITGNAADIRKAGKGDLFLKGPETIDAGIWSEEKTEEKDSRKPALRARINGLTAWVLRVFSFLKFRAEVLIRRGLKTASFYQPKRKGLIYAALAVSAVVLAAPIFIRSDRQQPVSAGEKDVLVTTDKDITARADDDAAPIKQSLLELAREAQAENNFSRAVELLEDAMARQEGNQNEIKALYVRAMRSQAALLLTNDADQTEKLLQKALTVDPQNALAHYDLGKLYSQTKELHKAIDAYKKAAALNSDSANTFFNLGFTYSAVNDYVNAEKMFLRVAELKPPYLDKAIVNLALVQYKQGKKQQCIENLRKALKVDPDNQIARKYLVQFTVASEKLP